MAHMSDLRPPVVLKVVGRDPAIGRVRYHQVVRRQRRRMKAVAGLHHAAPSEAVELFRDQVLGYFSQAIVYLDSV
ncbi:hypothetical protein AGR7A_Lc120649 [Agrobacterium deltaense NCPPB 1641]|uniref:Uncharacterized protein n=1 Tax=Agrobacterium deltaense NCPPB 1641 TaxID=1183425 RepID=A0A1S7TYM3_9HYPH|nr:hypothetical protein AGR7A_Lc120649 [Agrobacterium deltaense NCPPB 1641]